jgi:UDP-N-acetylmuramoylalanine--D-glutamate ligase
VEEQRSQAQALPFEGRHALVLGLGNSGLAMARWCAHWGARVTVLDSREAPPQLEALRSALPDAHYLQSVFAADAQQAQAVLEKLEAGAALAPSMLFVSPGLTPASTQALREAFQWQGLWVSGELGLFEHALKHLRELGAYAPKVIGVTGTNGKTTVTMLTTHLLKRCGLDAVAAGNVGDCMLDVLRDRLTARQLPQAWVLELSSFQLDAHCLRADAATVLNLTEDHLDWHGDMKAYAAAKARIFDGDGLAVVNREDAAVVRMLEVSEDANAKLDAPKRSKRADRPATEAVPLKSQVSFGASPPSRGGDFGLETVNGMTWLVRAVASDDAPRKKRGGGVQEVSMQRLMPADALRIRGQHNALNALASLALCTGVGMPLAPMLYGLREYAGEPHRCVSVAVIDDIEFVNDSKGTNVGATLAAIHSLGQDRGHKKLVLILGGMGKGQDFSPLGVALATYAKAMVLIGQDAPILLAQIETSQSGLSATPVLRASSMQNAVLQARRAASGGDAVLLSPACASFDMFKGYADRGEQFEACVHALAESRLEPA